MNSNRDDLPDAAPEPANAQGKLSDPKSAGNPAPPALAPPPLAESLVALGLFAIVAWSIWLWFGPALRQMWATMIGKG